MIINLKEEEVKEIDLEKGIIKVEKNEEGMIEDEKDNKNNERGKKKKKK